MAEISEEDKLKMKQKELLEEKEKLKELFRKLNAQASSFQKTAFELANYYFVSQAVVFTALAGDSSLVCRDVWFPLVLSLVPAVLNLCALGTIGNQYVETINDREETISEIENNFKKLHNIKIELDNIPKGWNQELAKVVDAKPDPSVKVKATFCFWLCMGAFAFFAILTAFGSIWILCKEKKLAKDEHA